MHPRCQHRWCRGRVARPTRALALTAALGALCDRPCRPYSTNASSDPAKTRTWDSRLRGPTSYPLSQRASIVRSAQTPRPRASAFAEPTKTAAKALPKTRRGLNYRCEGEIPCSELSKAIDARSLLRGGRGLSPLEGATLGHLAYSCLFLRLCLMHGNFH